jgi:integrase/recombinase XerD
MEGKSKGNARLRRSYLQGEARMLWAYGTVNGTQIRKSIGTKDLREAYKIIEQWDLKGRFPETPELPQAETVEHAWQLFMEYLDAQGLSPETVRKYRTWNLQMREFAGAAGFRFLNQLDRTVLIKFQITWKDHPLLASKKLERLRAFFRHCQDCEWIEKNPAAKLKGPKVKMRPTMPFDDNEVLRIFAAVQLYVKESAKNGLENARRLRAFVLLLHYTGMRISDVVSITADKIRGRKVFLYTHKTNVPVCIPIPDLVLRELEVMPRRNGKYLFWSGAGRLEGAVRSWQSRLRKLFSLAKVSDGHAHRFRDTFAVNLLLQGTPIEKVSVLLGHQSVRVTEKHYNPWVRSRQERLEDHVAQAWKCDPILLLETKCTRHVRDKREPVN